jgi:HSP20 family protein
MAFNRRGNLFDDIDREFAEMSRMFDRMISGLRTWDWDKVPLNQPVYYGVSVDVGPDGIPRVQQFGNVRPGQQNVQGMLEEGVREPFVSSTLDEEHNQLRVTAEMPGIDKKDVKVETTEEMLTLRAEGAERRYEKTLRLAIPVNPDSAKARYQNGVLEVTLDLKAPAKPKGHDVKVE